MDTNIIYKVNKITSSPNKKSILKQHNNSLQFTDENDVELNKSPIKKNITLPYKSPTKNKVSISNDSVTIHRYLSKSPIKKSKRLFTEDTNNTNNNNNDDWINSINNNINNNEKEIVIVDDSYENQSNNYNNINDINNDNNINGFEDTINQQQHLVSENELFIESNFYESIPKTKNDKPSNESIPKNKLKSYLNQLKQCIEYPMYKFDKFQEELTIFIYNNSQYTKYLIYFMAFLLNTLLIGYSLNYLGPIFGLVLLTIGITNSLTYFKSIKTYQLYRYEGKSFQSSNMSLIEIEHNGTIDKVPILKIWEPKFPSKILFSLFNPLNIVIMFKAGPNIEDFICFSGISFSISIMLYYIIEKYEEKINDEKIIFNQLVNEYNHHMRAVPSTRNKSTMTNE